ncbi:hypothetical protein C488_14227 [Natrinema pellirubrum DSM 15624]|uniref:Uncharacterized protein n=1 Tax=Natrinema pellirubrum (strain DSM 15624 / CIP 106293 / JCM 10476 / NCIMB 786 / 157) TaxID=797303 RepID=L9YG17_NATP1|nr:hypothetical protein C488_14227 [Natrinema pellirubrum DSM 15624]
MFVSIASRCVDNCFRDLVEFRVVQQYGDVSSRKPDLTEDRTGDNVTAADIASDGTVEALGRAGEIPVVASDDELI